MQAPNGKPASIQPRLVGLLFGDGKFYAYGDESRTALDVRAIDIPLFVLEVWEESPYSLVAKGLEFVAPKGANAFALSAPSFRYVSKSRYDIAVQFYAMPQESWRRSLQLPVNQDIVAGYFVEQLRNREG